MDNKPDSYYIEQLLKGNVEAFAALVERYSSRLFSLLVRMVRDEGMAEELLQDTFMKTYSALSSSSFRGGSSFSTYIYRIAYNVAVSSMRKKRVYFTEIGDSVRDAGDSEEPIDAREERYEALERALELISPEERALIQLFYYEEKPVTECADILGISESNVKVRLHRTRTKLYGIISPDYECE